MRGARCFFRFVLARCLPYSCSRESVQSASDCRIRIAPPPLTPEMAISASVRSALLDRPQIPPHSSARTEHPPFFRLKPAQAHLLRQQRWLPLKRTCCVNTAGLPVALPRVARFLLIPPVALPRVARFLLAPPVVLCADSFCIAAGCIVRRQLPYSGRSY